jgi:hypothetical protein
MPGETTATYSRYQLFCTVSGGTKLQPTIRCLLCLAELQLTVCSVYSALLGPVVKHLMRSSLFYQARQHGNRLSAALHSIWRYKTATDYLFRFTLSGESTADSLLRSIPISVYLLRLTIFCTAIHSVCRDDC